MPKMKTQSSAKKRFKLTGSGRVKAKASHMRHMQMNKPKSMKRKARGLFVLAEENIKMVIDNLLPYARAKKTKPPAAKADAKAPAKTSKKAGE
jgi:large subunit ribosomal protein L35